ncbi:DUF3857 domain-containing protein [Pantoea sp. 18069]|uniref:DUF3857 domain-containing protein n=1 Tax=Pantoea sp. 18069 TaxID=2681415 RepID=UPI00135BF542|nr:DUF3857 domain-containing protein [Pantoea sp. 18069]
MKIIITSLVLLTCLVAANPAKADAVAPGPSVTKEAAISNDFSYLRYRVDHEVHADASSVTTETFEILLKTPAAIDQFSQIYHSYSEKMETLEVLSAYTLTADDQRHDVAPERIYTQESYSSAAAPIYADHKVRVIVFPNLAPGSRLAYQIRRTRNIPHFPGYFSLLDTFSIFDQHENAEITLTAPADLPMNVFSRDVQGSNTATLRDGRAHWRWQYQRKEPLKVQNRWAAAWTFSPTIMASTYSDWSQVAKAYQVKAKPAAEVTPAIKTLAEKITQGVTDRRAQAAALHHWVAQNIRYVAVYLGNGGLEPNTAQSVLDHHYGDCKDHVVLLEALLAAKDIASSPALIRAGGGPLLPSVPLVEHFNHAITYIPEFDLYVDSTHPWARFGQLSSENLGAPVLHTHQAQLAHTPPNDHLRNHTTTTTELVFDKAGNLQGQAKVQLSELDEISLRAQLSQLNSQNRTAVEESTMAACGMNGHGRIEMQGDPFDLGRPFSASYAFRADDFIDFGMVGGIAVPQPPANGSFRHVAAGTAAPANATPFQCDAGLSDETYHMEFPADIPIIAIPASQHFRNAAGEYLMEWKRQGQRVSVHHRLQLNAMRGKGALCQPQDYPELRALYLQVKRGFRGQIVYGRLSNAARHPARR